MARSVAEFQLPGLNREELLTLSKDYLSFAAVKTYFPVVEPGVANACTLISGGAVQLLDVMDDPLPGSDYIYTHSTKFLMKIQHIEEVVDLCYFSYGSKDEHTSVWAVEIGEQKYVYAEGVLALQYRGDGCEVLTRLHEALGVPEDQTEMMLRSLFTPTCVGCFFKEFCQDRNMGIRMKMCDGVICDDSSISSLS